MPHFDLKLDGCREDQATTRSFATDSGTGETGGSTENEGCVEARRDGRDFSQRQLGAGPHRSIRRHLIHEIGRSTRAAIHRRPES
jgi:hypothetical protein